jgi:opine dehydrogenase
MYHEGITESVALVIREIYEESARIAQALHFEMVKYRDVDFRTKCSIMGVEFQAPFDTCGVIGSILGPTSVHDRYITEDLPFGLVPRSQLGKLVGVPTPVIDGIVSIGSIVCRDDFWRTDRTLESLGLAELTKEEIVSLVNG